VTIEIRHRPAVVAATAVLLLSLAGCAPTEAASDAGLPKKNLSEWTMPLDPYVYSFPVEDNYAERLLTQPCMEGQGFAYEVPWRNLDALRSESYNAVGIRLFDERLASKWGYRDAPLDDPSAAAAYAGNEQALSPAGESALTDCLAEVRSGPLPLLPGFAQNTATYAADALVAANDTPEVKKAAEAWRSCMLPAGVEDLPGSPNKMPSPSLQNRFAMKGDGASGARASAEEIKMATTDAECRKSTGWVQALYDSAWNYQVGVLDENADDLSAIGEALEEHKARVSSIIAERAPSR
jgi:hypothetical protein